ncbi:MAG: hypothetical protein ACREBR_00280 [bacterium]
MRYRRAKKGWPMHVTLLSLGTAACSLRLAGLCEQPKLANQVEGIKGGSRFGSSKLAAECGRRGMKCVMQIKTGHRLFPKKDIEAILKNNPGGVHIVLKGKHPNGVPLVAIGYKYNSKTVLHFVMTEDAGSTALGKCYEMKYPDLHGNVCVRHVERPAVISNFFRDSNVIDTHNHARQSELALEKKWATQDPYFRLLCTIIGFTVTDVWKLAHHHHLFNAANRDASHTRMPINRFAGILAKQLLGYANSLTDERVPINSVSTGSTNGSVSDLSGGSDEGDDEDVEDANLRQIHTDINGIYHEI